jgi:hypothetical protein
VREPVGVVAAITPWNVPLYVNIGKVVAALLAGCTVILKPAPDTPGMGAIFGELAQKAGFPAGVINVVFGSDPAEAGEMLVQDPRVDLISFTGSTGVGKRIMEQGAKTLKRVFLELGGKSAKIVLDDAPNFAMEVAHDDPGVPCRAGLRRADRACWSRGAGTRKPRRSSRGLCRVSATTGATIDQSRAHHGAGRSPSGRWSA